MPRPKSWTQLLLAATLVATAMALLQSTTDAAAAHGTAPGLPLHATIGTPSLATVTITNASSVPDSASSLSIDNLRIVPSCGATGPTATGDCSVPDPGVFEVPTTAIGSADSACAGLSFTLAAEAGSTTGRLIASPS